MHNPIEIDTERLTLRQWCEADREPFAVLCADPRVVEFLLPISGRMASDSLIDRLSSHILTTGWGFWATELRASQEFIGFIGIQVPQTRYPFSPCVEAGWRLASKHWGNGYATEGAKAALRVGFELLGLSEIVSFTAIDNKRSRSVMEKAGMKGNGETFKHPAIPDGHPLQLQCLYRIAREDWLTQNKPIDWLSMINI
ncbi:MAG: Acetyltransferase (GNAT) family protein [Syntrophorhabdus sp. PtaU1.Bin002]|nr:MAG: Acetyltransferase (GNAT) family protein [Syntrophorhabdus sp. PtaU1.Bin002]